MSLIDKASFSALVGDPAQLTVKLASLLDTVADSEEDQLVDQTMQLLSELAKDHPETVDCIADALWWATCTSEKESETLQFLVSQLPLHEQLQESLDFPYLQDKDLLLKKLRIHNTSLNYRQAKYNLLAEESEGYSKYLHLLAICPDNITLRAEALIGTFSLDPNRCVDLILTVIEFESKQGIGVSDKLLELLRGIQTDKLPSLLQNYSHAVKVTLVLADIVSLLELVPSDFVQALETFHGTVQERAKQHVKDLMKISPKVSDNKDIPPAEQFRKEHEFVGFLESLLHSGISWTKLESVFSDKEWSQLCIVFPKTVGLCICNWVASKIVEPALKDTPPWIKKGVESRTLEELLEQIIPPLMVTFDSGAIALHPALYTQTCRLIRQFDHVKDVGNDLLLYFLRQYLVPCLSLFVGNAAVSLELWEVVKAFPYIERYSLYDSWRGSGLENAAARSLDKPFWAIAGELQAGKDARYALKRLSKDTLRDMSRVVTKVCHAHPLVVFTTILNQIESYDNMIQVMVDALRWVTPLSLDVLSFCILSRLRGTGEGLIDRNRLKQDGVNVSQWLQSLESFTGAFFKRFPFVEFQGILIYLMQRLKEGQVMELGVLKTLLKQCGGWAFSDYSPAASLSMTQLEGRSGSNLLKRETMSFGVVDEMNVRASNEVRRVLLQGNMGVSLLILLSQLRDQIVFESNSKPPKPVKLIGNLYDNCQVTLSILLDFLTNSLDNETRKVALVKHASSFPTLQELHDLFKVDMATAWMLCRPLLRAAKDPDIALTSMEFTDATREWLQSLLPETLKPDLYEAFFTKSLYDIFCPKSVYETELARLEKEFERLTKQKTDQEAEELERVKRVLDRLPKDKEYQMKHVQSVRGQLETEKGPDDAMYCARFIDMLHVMETPGFGTLHLYDVLFVSFSRALFGMTEGEAASASILLHELWKIVSRWRYDRSAYEKEVAGKPGALMLTEDNHEAFEVTHEDFIALYNKWHADVGVSCIGCLRSKEYIHKRNCLIVLTRMVEVYPTRPGLAYKIIQELEPLQDESNTLADIRASAQAYNMQLLKARDEGVWKEEDEAIVQARVRQEQEAAAERQKKAEQQMAEMKRDSEKISDQLGHRDDFRRGMRNAPPATDERQREPDRRDERRRDDRRHLDDRRGPSGAAAQLSRREPARGDERWPRGESYVQPRGGEAPRGLDARWERTEPRRTGGGPLHDTAGPAARGASRPVGEHGGGPRSGAEQVARIGSEPMSGRSGGENPAALQTARDRGRSGGASKRSRPSSPVEQGEAREEASAKRARGSDEEESGRRGEAGRRQVRRKRR